MCNISFCSSCGMVCYVDCRLSYVLGIAVPTISQLSHVCDNLGSSHLLLVEPSRLGVHRRIQLNVNPDDIIFGLQSSAVYTPCDHSCV